MNNKNNKRFAILDSKYVWNLSLLDSKMYQNIPSKFFAYSSHWPGVHTFFKTLFNQSA